MKKVAALVMIGAAIFPLCAMFAIPAIGQYYSTVPYLKRHSKGIVFDF
jgi:hypothetical protein